MLNILKRTKALETHLDILEVLESTPKFTPDMWLLEQKEYHAVFLCDEIQLGHRMHDLVIESMSGTTPLFDGYTSEKMCFLIKNLERMSVPLVFKDFADDDLPVWMQKQCRIRGEVYGLAADCIKRLDDYRQNGVQFERIKININVPYHKKFRTRSQNYDGKWWASDYKRSKDYIVSIPCYMYVARPEYWMDQLKARNGCFNFDPVKTWSVDRIWIKEYFEYRRFV